MGLVHPLQATHRHTHIYKRGAYCTVMLCSLLVNRVEEGDMNVQSDAQPLLDNKAKLSQPQSSQWFSEIYHINQQASIFANIHQITAEATVQRQFGNNGHTCLCYNFSVKMHMILFNRGDHQIAMKNSKQSSDVSSAVTQTVTDI